MLLKAAILSIPSLALTITSADPRFDFLHRSQCAPEKAMDEDTPHEAYGEGKERNEKG